MQLGTTKRRRTELHSVLFVGLSRCAKCGFLSNELDKKRFFCFVQSTNMANFVGCNSVLFVFAGENLEK